MAGTLAALDTIGQGRVSEPSPSLNKAMIWGPPGPPHRHTTVEEPRRARPTAAELYYQKSRKAALERRANNPAFKSHPAFKSSPSIRASPTRVDPTHTRAASAINEFRDALASYQWGDYDQAVESLDKAMKAGTLAREISNEALIYLAASAYWLGRTPKATQALRTLFNSSPSTIIDSAIFPPEFITFAENIRAANSRP